MLDSITFGTIRVGGLCGALHGQHMPDRLQWWTLFPQLQVPLFHLYVRYSSSPVEHSNPCTSLGCSGHPKLVAGNVGGDTKAVIAVLLAPIRLQCWASGGCGVACGVVCGVVCIYVVQCVHSWLFHTVTTAPDNAAACTGSAPFCCGEFEVLLWCEHMLVSCSTVYNVCMVPGDGTIAEEEAQAALQYNRVSNVHLALWWCLCLRVVFAALAMEQCSM